MKKFNFIILFLMIISLGIFCSCSAETLPQGPQGEPGKDGVDGEDGHTPVITIGENGNWYIDGVDTGVSASGPKGEQGIQGEKGEQGIQGEKGEQGQPGKDGADGQDGQDGKDGHSPEITIGENGNWFIDGVDTGVKAQGDKGNTGFQGNPGKDGTSLLTGYGKPANDKGINGDSYIDLSSWDFYIKVNDKWTFNGNIKGDASEETTIYNTEGLVFTPINDKECSVSIGNGEERFLKEIYIPSTFENYVVTRIDDGIDNETGEILGGFIGLSHLEKVYIPNTIKYIGFGSFAYCSNLKEVIFEEGIEIDNLNNAFTGCRNITNFEIPDGVKKLNDAEFDECNLSSLIVPSSVKSIGGSAIYSEQLYRSIYYKGTIEEWLNIEFDSSCFTGKNGVTSMYLLDENDEWEQLKEIVIPESITEVNLYSFSLISFINSVEIHKNVKTIYSSNNQFRNIYFNGTLEDWLKVERSNQLGSNLYFLDEKGDVEHNGKTYSLFDSAELVIPEGITEIKSYAFANCDFLESVTIPKSVTSIGASAFYKCSSLTSITIPESVTSIGNFAFNSCASLKEITLPNKDINFGDNVFNYCNSIEKATLPTTAIFYIPRYNLKEVVINGGNTIGDYAFDDCISLTSITIPESVTSIGRAAFYNCISLTSITIPENVTSIGEAAFYNCSSLTSITIPENVTSIGESAFSNCSLLTSITIPESVTSIERNAFCGCSSLVSITLPFVGENYDGSGSTYFGYIFDSYSYILPSSLKEVIITCSTKIGENAFYDCSSLTSITIPESVTSIGRNAFRGCSGLENIYYNGTLADWCKIYFENNLSNPMYPSYNGNLYFLDEKGVVDYNGEKYTLQDSLLVITEDITEINQYAFYGCDIWGIHYDGFESDFYEILYNKSLAYVFDNFSNITIYSLNTIKQIRSEQNMNKLYNIKGIVIEKFSVGYIVYDGTGFITVYLNELSPYEIGEYLHIKGYISLYANSPQFSSEAVVSKLDEPIPEHINIDNEKDLIITEEYLSNVMESWKYNDYQPGGVYGTLEGTLTNDTYYLLSTDHTGINLSPYIPTQEDAALYDQYLGKKVHCEIVLMHVINENTIQVVILSINLVE